MGALARGTVEATFDTATQLTTAIRAADIRDDPEPHLPAAIGGQGAQHQVTFAWTTQAFD